MIAFPRVRTIYIYNMFVSLVYIFNSVISYVRVKSFEVMTCSRMYNILCCRIYNTCIYNYNIICYNVMLILSACAG